MNEIEKYIKFLEERIATSSSPATNNAYTIALHQFKNIFKI